MFKRIARLATLALSALVLSAGSALAQVDVEMAFSPDTAHPGDTVTLFASVANLGSEPALAQFSVTIALGELTFGPVQHPLPLAAGEEHSAEIPFVVPPVPFGGTLTITVTAESGIHSDTAIASLTIVTNIAAAPDANSLRSFATRIATELGGGSQTLATNPATLTEVKRFYR